MSCSKKCENRCEFLVFTNHLLLVGKIRKVGGKAFYFGRVGKDHNAKVYRQDLEKIGIDCHLAEDSASPTGVCLALVTPDAERTMMTSLDAAVLLNESDSQDDPIGESPYPPLLTNLSPLQHRLPFSVEFSPLRIAILTATNAPAEMRLIKTLRHWGIYVNEIFFLGGVDKTKILRAFKPHIFFDDQDLHLDPAAKHVPSGRVPYHSESPLNSSKATPEGESQVIEDGAMNGSIAAERDIT